MSKLSKQALQLLGQEQLMEEVRNQQQTKLQCVDAIIRANLKVYVKPATAEELVKDTDTLYKYIIS
jgi:flagellin-specific chaperone FliS